MDTQALDARAREILKGNDRGGYTVPTAGLYPYQWNWDSAFAAWGFSTFSIERAWVEIETLVSGQWPSGMIPHILFHKPDPGYFPGPDVWGAENKGPIPSSGISQPPVAATFLRAIWDADNSRPTDRLKPIVGALVRWHRWFMDWRSDNGTIFVTHPWEAGRDNCLDWDSAMMLIDPAGVGEYTRRDTSHVDPSMRPTKADYDRYIWLVQRGRQLGWDDAEMAKNPPFRVADPTMSFILLRAHRDLCKLMATLGLDTGEVEGWIATLAEGAPRLKNPETRVYDAINLTTNQHTGTVSSAAFLSWYAGLEDDDMEKALDACFASCPYPVPSEAVDQPEFNPKRYWRGPTWAIVNALIAIGLRDMGHDDKAERLRTLTRDLIAEHGFAEYFNPLNGDPAGGGTFTWTAAVWLAWASDSAERG